MSLTEALIETVSTFPAANEEPLITAALFAEMSADEENDAPEQIAQGVRDWEAFRDAINETRANAGARIIYPKN